ncbi:MULTISPECIES: ADP-ribosylglycohydrolase family protein [Kitasatospora]|uniref:ADP-ribosylglycohydrolase family protein n=1 Tax=Kitasatospora TaxID=2063 RepID=UPI000C70A3BC|nr:ADP-ribosylglycohydrolase family protein [Kitasatospora sp. GP30]MDH6140876.1 ADP-ribosylglycohydrolase [Kitasatospora sp. GP30]
MKRASGALLGLALGDALGAPTEFQSMENLARSWPDWRQLPLRQVALVTDDTQMTLSVARALRTALADGPLTAERFTAPLRAEYVEWWRSPQNNRAPGFTCLSACQELSHRGVRWQEASRIGSKGCGANMRVAPLGLVRGLTMDQLAGGSQLQAALTHGHPTGLAASELTALTVWLLTQDTAPAQLPALLRAYAAANRTKYREDWLGDLWTQSHRHDAESFITEGWDQCLAVLDRLDQALAAADREADPCLITGEGWIAEEAFASALLCFLLFPDDPVAAIRRAAYSSGDSDSLACLAGAFAGAHHGADAWPADWVERIEHRDELLEFGALWD